MSYLELDLVLTMPILVKATTSILCLNFPKSCITEVSITILMETDIALITL